MPAYDYRCLSCRRRFEITLSYSEYGKVAVHCPYCGSDHVQRRIGRVRVMRGDQSHLADMADPSNLDALEDDPRTLGRMMRQMSSQLGEDMGSEFEEVVGRLEKGQSPQEIERDLPDIAPSMDGSDADFED